MVTALFGSTLFLSALLLFLVQPMFAKMVLPRLGGTPAVWNTCVVFFQLTLLAGYVYTHATVRWLGVRRQALLHVAVLALPLLLLPIRLDPHWQPPPTANPVYWLLMVLTVVAGLPFLVVSTSAPLLQRWYAATGHTGASDPFFLYAASNLGSLGALFAYPTVIEPLLKVQNQSRLWAWGYAALAVAIAACAGVTWRSTGRSVAEGTERPAASPSPAWGTRLLWLGLSAVPSSLMLSVTTYVSTDIASVPLLWVVPLALYLLTFVIAFARRPPVSWLLVSDLFPLIVLLPATVMVLRDTPPLGGIPLHFAAFFAAALLCHGRLASSRPSAEHLTEFYVWLSLGGALGGMFNTLVAPLVFKTVAEYPLGLVAACLLRQVPARPATDGHGGASGTSGRAAWRPIAGDVLAVLALFAVTWAVLAAADAWSRSDAEWIYFGRTFAVPFAVCLVLSKRPSRFALAIGAVLYASSSYDWTKRPVLSSERTFFGLHQVVDRGNFLSLINGTTSHGSQAKAASARCEPTAYYGRTSPVGQLFGTFVGTHTRRRIGSIGLGAGTLAAYSQRGQAWTFFEINPAIRQIAESGVYFTYLRACIGDYTIELGDARQSLARAPAHSYDVLVFDAFSSDAIPVHLITLEAIEGYLEKLTPGGVLVFHISNRYLDLGPVLGAVANRLGLTALIQSQDRLSREATSTGMFESTWVVMARSAEDLGDVALDPRWKPLAADRDAPLWTDDFSDIVSILNW